MTGWWQRNFPGRRGPWFVASWLAMVALFWIVVWANLGASQKAPLLTATNRNVIDYGKSQQMEMYWRYAGPRPAQGEVLAAWWRQAHIHTDAHRTDFVACLGNAERPDPKRPVAVPAVEPAKNFFDWHRADLQPWSEDAELWLGIRFKANAITWREAGDAGFADLPGKAWSLDKSNGRLRQERQAFFPSISTRVLPEGTAEVSLRRPWISLLLFAAAALVPTIFLAGYRRWWLVGVVYMMVLLYKAMEVLFPSQWLWGGFHVLRMEQQWFWTGLVLLHVATFPVVGAVVRLASNRVWGLGVRYWRWPLTWLAIPAVAVAALWCAQRFTSLGVYGDAYGSLAIPGYDYHNPFSTALYHAWRDGYAWWMDRRGENVVPGYADFNLVPKFVTGWMLLYATMVGILARMMGRTGRERVMFFVGFMGLKTLLTHFGHVEVYGPALALQALLLVLIVGGLRRGRVVLATALSFFCYLFQMGAAMALPAIVVLWATTFWRTGGKVPWLLTRLAATAALALMTWAACLGTLYIFKHDFKMESFKQHVPAKEIVWEEAKIAAHGLPMLIGSTGRDKREVFLHWSEPHVTHFYLLRSWHHASQVLGELVFVSGPVLPWLLLGFVLSRRRGWRSPERWAICAAGGAFLLSAIFLATNYPYPKDWDVFALHGFWWMAGWFVCVARGGCLPPAAARWALAALAVYLLWDTGHWMVYNMTWGPPPAERMFVFF